MSQAPFIVRNTRFGTTLGANYNFEDSLWVRRLRYVRLVLSENVKQTFRFQTALTDTYCKLPMALTAENLAVKYNINREAVDKFALRSQQNWKKGSHDSSCSIILGFVHK